MKRLREFFKGLALCVVAVAVAECSACSSTSLPSIVVRSVPQTVVLIVHDSSTPSHSKYIPDLRPYGRTKTDPALPWIAEYQPPAEYARWWTVMARCGKVEAPAELTRKVKWIRINAVTFGLATEMQRSMMGLTDPDALTIFVAEPSVKDSSVVMHEMRHMADSWNGVDEGKDYHPYGAFEECGLHVSYP